MRESTPGSQFIIRLMRDLNWRIPRSDSRDYEVIGIRAKPRAGFARIAKIHQEKALAVSSQHAPNSDIGLLCQIYHYRQKEIIIRAIQTPAKGSCYRDYCCLKI